MGAFDAVAVTDETLAVLSALLWTLGVWEDTESPRRILLGGGVGPDEPALAADDEDFRFDLDVPVLCSGKPAATPRLIRPPN